MEQWRALAIATWAQCKAKPFSIRVVRQFVLKKKKYIITYGTTATTSSHRFLAEKSKLNLKEKLKVSLLSISSNTSIKVCSFCVIVVTWQKTKINIRYAWEYLMAEGAPCLLEMTLAPVTWTANSSLSLSTSFSTTHFLRSVRLWICYILKICVFMCR